MNKNIAEIYEKYAGLITYIGYLQTGSRQEAEEITQEVFIRYMTSSMGMMEQKAIKGWLIKVAVNLCLDIKRKFWVRLRYLSGTSKEKAEEKFVLNSLEIQDQLRHTLMRLDGKSKMAIILKYAKEMEVNEIAEVMNLNPNTVKTLIFRGLKKLKLED